MKDIGSTRPTDDPTRDAIVAVVRRVQYDPDLAYLLGRGTETYELLHRALRAWGLSTTEATEALRYRDTRTVRMVEYRDRVDRLEAYLDAHCPNWRDEVDP
jgi:hypothetical protein